MSILGLKEKQISEIKDPFAFDNIIKFSTYCSKQTFGGGWYYMGSVEFKNGNTKGEQKFEADNFSALIRKMEAFLKEFERL